jgi:predicted dehydrogenase
LKVGIIGYGERIAYMAAQFAQFERGVRLAAIADPRAGAICEKIQAEEPGSDIRYYTTAEDMLAAESLDGVMIGTRCSLHAHYGSMILRHGLPLFLEKPVATNHKDITLLEQSGFGLDNRVVVSFPLRVSDMVIRVREILDTGIIGKIQHAQAWNNVPYGGVYYHHWYRDEHETGGLFLQKATHDFDYLNLLLDERPVEVCAMKSKQVFKGTKPASLRCTDCAEYHTCPESPLVFRLKKHDTPIGEYCCFAVDTGNEDSGSAIVRYESGLHVSYSQNFFARKAAAARGTRLFGYNGTLEFDWYTGMIKVFRHDRDLVETYAFDTGGDEHFGGDSKLVENFIDVMEGKADSIAPLSAGILSVKTCLAATKACASGRTEYID